MKRMRPFLCAVLLGGAVTLLWQEQPVTAQATGLAKRIVPTDPATFRMSPAVHGGAGSMGFTALLNRGAVTPEFNFLHRGVIPPGAGIGHHFHNTVEEMFVILDGEAQFTIDGRTATVKGPAGVICRTGHSHAIYNASSTPVQWMNLNVSLIAGVYDAFDLGDTRATAALDPVPPFMTLRLDRALLRAPGGRGRGAAPAAPAANAVQSRRALAPSVFSTTWAYVDHVLVPPGGSTPELAHESVGEAYYVMAGSGTLTVKGQSSETAPVRTGDAIPIRIGESTQFTNTGSEPLELFVMGVAKDMAAKTQLLAGGAQK
ncbi:MAG TPA: cupin domain-containing protein [Vicinamibacterales bacterium]|nr:cupin domain-containing protein [Vicinamibacterales bacterium]